MMADEVEQFFQRYASAAEAMDVDELASLHHAPCLKVHGDGVVRLLPTHSDVRAFFREFADRYASRDHSGGHFRDLEVQPIGTEAALVTLTWQQFRADGNVYRRFRRSYNLVRIGPEWKILLTTFHRE